MKLEVHKLRVNVKSLASEARFIRQEMTKCRDPKTRVALTEHRRSRLRPEARLAYLALAYIKGTPYRVAEPRTSKTVNVIDLFTKIKKFRCVTPDEVKAWVEAV